MIDFIFASILYIVLMFLVFFVLTFVTVGITFSAVVLARNLIQRMRLPHQFALK